MPSIEVRYAFLDLSKGIILIIRILTSSSDFLGSEFLSAVLLEFLAEGARGG